MGQVFSMDEYQTKNLILWLIFEMGVFCINLDQIMLLKQ